MSANMTCPSGGSFYACNTTTSKFVGCCKTNPCSIGCGAGSIVPTSFNVIQYDAIPDQQCEAGLFYKCTYAGSNPAKPPFFGCCRSNACTNSQGSCPQADLAAASLNSSPALGINVFIPSSSSSTSSGIFSTPSSQSTAPAAAGTSRTDSSKASLGAIIGGAVGGAVALILAVILACILIRRRKRRSNAAKSAAATSGAGYDTLQYPTKTDHPPPSSPYPGSELSNQHYSANYGSPYKSDASVVSTSNPGSPYKSGVSEFEHHQHLQNMQNMQTMSAGTTVAGSPEMEQVPVFQTQAGLHRYFYERMYPPQTQSGLHQSHHEMEGSSYVSELPAGEHKRL